LGLCLSFELVVCRCFVELGGGQMCGAHTVSLLAACGCIAMSLGYMPLKECIPVLAYILAF
ncbi:MAG TPA: hypothetical protein VFI36_03305, partial [Arthrobacter sp.]|nr:hypothetical protein [Arthrobacter sp.]